MSRSFSLSSDPRPNHPFTATFVIEGTEDGKPLAVVGDEYIIAAPRGSILFDPHSMRIKKVDEKTNHRAELEFVSREGFNQSGQFKLACMLARDPIVREEITVTVVATSTPATTAPTEDTLPIATIKTSEATPRPGVPLIGAPVPIPVATPVMPTVVAPVTLPTVAPIVTPPARSFRKPIIIASLVVLMAIVIAAGFFFTKEPVHTSNTPATTNIPDVVDNKKDAAKAPEKAAQKTAAPNAATTPPTHVPQAPAAPEPEVGDDKDEPNEEIEEVADPQDQQPSAAAPPIEAAPKCGACP